MFGVDPTVIFVLHQHGGHRIPGHVSGYLSACRTSNTGYEPSEESELSSEAQGNYLKEVILVIVHFWVACLPSHRC
jgi:hypothetical protein